MAPILLRAALPLLLAGGVVGSPAAGVAAPNARPAVQHVPLAVTAVANWRCPYCNIDRRWDAGNDTGDSMVERLNQEQLNRGFGGGYRYPGPYRRRWVAPPPYAPGYPPYAPGY